ncbi:MAG TPA: hypothetical protein VFR84_19135 [Candidatus Angelobacter sp.]|nr:hypothetical protein [Candidatus Angelobacter sp.]
MKRRVQIVVSSGPAGGHQGIAPRLSVWQRFKLLIIGTVLAAGVVALLIVAIVVGSIVATFILLAMAVAVVVFVVRAKLRRWRR